MKEVSVTRDEACTGKACTPDGITQIIYVVRDIDVAAFCSGRLLEEVARELARVAVLNSADGID